MHKLLNALIVVALPWGCANTVSNLKSGEKAKLLDGLESLPMASDADKMAAIPSLLDASMDEDREVRRAVGAAMDALHFSDARLGWRVAATDRSLCPKAIASVQRRWPDADDLVRDGLVLAMAGGRCPEVDEWIWQLVETTDTKMTRETGLFGWLDTRRDGETTARLLRLSRSPQAGDDRIGPVCELLAARAKAGQLEAARRLEALQLVHDVRATPGVRTVLGEALLGGQPPLAEDAVLGVVAGSEAPSELRKSALSGLPGGGDVKTLSAAGIQVLGKVVTDPASPPDLRAYMAGRIAERPVGDALPFLKAVAEDVDAPRDLRSTMMEHILGWGGEPAAGVLANIVVQTDSPPDLRSSAMSAFERAWSAQAGVACQKVCEMDPLGELCVAAIGRLRSHGSPRAADAAAYGFTLRIMEAKEPYAIKAVRDEIDDATLAALADQTRAYALTVSAIVAADAAAARRFGEDEKGLKIDPAICTMREGWEKVNALKAEGKKSEAGAVQRTMYRADHLLREPDVDAKVKAAKRVMKGALAEAGPAAASLTDPALSERVAKFLADKVGLKAVCVLLPDYQKAVRNAKRSR